jgi:hypothetical protein
MINALTKSYQYPTGDLVSIRRKKCMSNRKYKYQDICMDEFSADRYGHRVQAKCRNESHKTKEQLRQFDLNAAFCPTPDLVVTKMAVLRIPPLKIVEI